MTTYERLLIVIAVAVVGTGGWWIATHPDITAQLAPRMPEARVPPHPAVARSQAFGPSQNTSFRPSEINTFLENAMVSEAMADPLQRCMTYPDPPGSHWSHAATDAYCRFRTQPYIHRAEVQEMIRNGQAAALDSRLADALLRQRTQADARGLLDHLYNNDFADGSPGLRASLDAWKRRSPKSTFAFAASGRAYVEAAAAARGTNWVSETPAENLQAMSRLLALARTDLTQATELDAHNTPAFEAMVIAARMEGDDDYANTAAMKGLAADPASYSLHAQLMVTAQPKWGGSFDAMAQVAAHAQAQSAKNPLLVLLLAEPAAYASGICGCGGGDTDTPAAYRTVLDQVAATSTLSAAGNNAFSTQQSGFALVYLSEALRFSPQAISDRMSRINLLSTLQYEPSLRAEANRAMLAEADRLLTLAPADGATQAQIGEIYVLLARWDKAWDLADAMIRTSPEAHEGWALRAVVQRNQPRPGLRDTERYLVEHFSTDPDAVDAVTQARADLAAEQRRSP